MLPTSAAPAVPSDGLIRALFEGASQGIVAVDQSGRILMVNHKTEELFGYPRGELVGQSVESLVPASDAANHAAHRAQFFAGPRLRPMGIGLDLKARRRDGTEFPVEIALSFVDEGGARVAVAMITDITWRKQRDEELRLAKEAAEAANRSKSSFLAAISHDIRTPIHGVLGLAEVLRGMSLGPREHEVLDSLQSTAQLLLGIVDGVLDLSTIEAGKLTLHTDAFDLRGALASVIGLYRPQAEAGGLQLLSEVADNVPPQVVGDAGRVCQIWMNLVGNAIKFTQQGRVTVTLAASELQANSVHIELVVSDTGTGMRSEEQERAFEPFTRLHGIERSGTGLGLTISRHLAWLMGGTITVRSEPGTGSAFHVKLPLRLPTPEEALHAEPPSTAQPLRPLRVLVAEDDPVSRKMLVSLLARQGHEVVAVESGTAAVSAASASGFEMILMDVEMPGLSGLQATGAIREMENGSGRHVPIVVVTAHVLTGEKERCLSTGADAYLPKPFSAKQLERVVRELAQRG